MAALSNITNVCRACKAEKPIGEFYLVSGRGGKRYAENECKACKVGRAQQRKATSDPAEAQRRRTWRRDHKRKLRIERGCVPRDVLAQRAQERRAVAGAKRQKQHDSHIKRYGAVVRARLRQQKASKTPEGIINGRMRVALRKALRGRKAGRRWEALVGYTLADLVRHIERQFTKGMAWERVGVDIHIDHILPRAMFRYATEHDEDFRTCWALTNLRPMWAGANKTKGAKRQNLI